MRWWKFYIALFFIGCTNAQFGEIASLATSLLGGALGNGAGIGALAGAGAAGAGAAGQAGGALAQIGQLYQLAQGALQLTGTGVGVLNQASEGNWFPAVLEQTAKNSQALMKSGNGLNLGSLGPAPGKSAGIGPEFGTSFPAPNIDDYDENAEIPGVTTEKKTPKAPDGLVDIEDEDYEIDTTQKPTTTTTEATTTTTETVSFFSREKEESEDEEEEETTTEPTTLPPRQIRIQLPDKNGNTEKEDELDYEDLIKKNQFGTDVHTLKSIDSESTDELKRNVITHGAKTQPIVPKLDKLVEVLQKSKLSKEEIDEIVSQVEGNKHIEKPAKYDFNAAVQNIPDKKNIIRQKITDASRIINSNFENQNREQSSVIQRRVDELKIFPEATITTKQHMTTPKPSTTTATHIASTTIATTTIASTTIASTTIASTKKVITSTPPQKHIQQARSIQVAPQVPVLPQTSQPTPVVPPTSFVPVTQNQKPDQSQLFNNYYPNYQIQQPFQQQFYYHQAPTQNQQNQFSNYQVQQPNGFAHTLQYGQTPFYGVTPQQQQQQQQYNQQTSSYSSFRQPQYQQQNQLQKPQQQIYYAQHAQQNRLPQQSLSNNPQASNPQLPYTTPQQIQIPTAPVHQPVQQRPAHQFVYQQGNAQPTAKPTHPAPYVHPNGNTNQVVHYYHDGKQVIQQIIPKQIASGGTLPVNGPFQSHVSGVTDPVEYQRTQRTLQQAYHQPHTRGAVSRQESASQPVPNTRPKIYESTVTAIGRQAHAIRTYQASKPTHNNPQPSAAIRRSGRMGSPKKRIDGHVLPGPTIDHRSLLEKRTTAKPRYVRVP